MGNSFFKPYAEHRTDVAADAGLENHSSRTVFCGGDNGRPISFWNDTDSEEHQLIKSTLDDGEIEYFGMTAGHDTFNRIEGHRTWIEYALQNNPNVTIFIAIPQIDFPAEWPQRAQEFGFDTIRELNDYFVNVLVHDSIVDPLRVEFPSTNIFTIPTGWASLELAQMKQDDTLLDDIAYQGPKATSLFTDAKGHKGQIIIETGTLIWLSSIYDIDLSTNNYDTGFNTDLHQVAQGVIDSHDANYKQ